MTRVRQIKTNFTAGEVSRELLGRGDLRVYENGALALRNLFIFPTGGVTRRTGLGFVDMAGGDGRLIAFEFNTQQAYLLAATPNALSIYATGVKIQTLSTPWSAADLPQLTWTQSADTLLLTHPDYPPKKLLRTASGVFALEDWQFFANEGVVFQPFYKFADSTVTLTPGGTEGIVTLTASAPVFEAGHTGTVWRIGEKQAAITAINSPTVATASLSGALENGNPTIDWAEPAFSEVRGYPSNVAFHQDRLVIGGSRDLPNRLWFSKSGDLFNFDLGEGLDDEAIEFAILSDQVNAIRGIFSGRHLQVFTSGAEWMVTGDPLTPSSVQLNRQTRVGSVVERYIPPVTVDGATMFVARNGQEIREFLYTDVEQAYQATDLALVSRHILGNPVDQDFDARRRLLFIVRGDGKFATLTIYRAEQVAAWTLHDTQGAVKSVCVVGDDVYMLVERGGNHMIEEFRDNLNLDSALTGESTDAVTQWSGLDHLEGAEVSIIADGRVVEPKTVSGGMITLDDAAKTVEIGLPYTHIIEPLPPASDSGAIIRKIRLVELVLRVQDCQALRLDVGQGLRDIPLRNVGGDIMGKPPQKISGDIRVRALGWQKDGADPLWRIEQSAPLPFTLLSAATELKVND